MRASSRLILYLALIPGWKSSDRSFAQRSAVTRMHGMCIKGLHGEVSQIVQSLANVRPLVMGCDHLLIRLQLKHLAWMDVHVIAPLRGLARL